MTDEPPRQAAVRAAVVWDTLTSVLTDLSGPGGDGDVTVVDLGGGTGGLAVRVAELGHQVVVVDPSPDALASLHRRATDRGVAGRVVAVQGDAGDLTEHVPDASAHLVLCHGVLEVVDHPGDALSAVRRALRPGGVVSVLVAGRLSAVLTRAIAGDFSRAQRILDSSADTWDLQLDGSRRYDRDEIVDALTEQGLTVERVDAVRVFAGLVPNALVDIEPGARQSLLQLERAIAPRAEFSAVAAQHHVIARR